MNVSKYGGVSPNSNYVSSIGGTCSGGVGGCFGVRPSISLAPGIKVIEGGWNFRKSICCYYKMIFLEFV